MNQVWLVNFAVEMKNGTIKWYYSYPLKKMTVTEANCCDVIQNKIFNSKTLVTFKKSFKYNANGYVMVKAIDYIKPLGL